MPTKMARDHRNDSAMSANHVTPKCGSITDNRPLECPGNIESITGNWNGAVAGRVPASAAVRQRQRSVPARNHFFLG